MVNSRPRISHDRAQKAIETLGKGPYGLFLENVGVVFETSVPYSGGFDDLQYEIEIGRAGIASFGLHRQTAHLKRRQRGGLQDEHGLDVWRPAQVSDRIECIDQPFEGDLLVLIGV